MVYCINGDLTGDTFTRYHGNGDFYYYAKQIVPDRDGSYVIKVVGGDIKDTYLYLYAGRFNKYKPANNLLYYNDDYNGFWSKINYTLKVGKKYVVVITTYYPGVSGYVYVDIWGPGKIYSKLPYPLLRIVPLLLKWARDRIFKKYK